MSNRDRIASGRPVQTWFRIRDELRQLDAGVAVASVAAGRPIARAKLVRAAAIALSRRPLAIAIVWERVGSGCGETEDALVDMIDAWLDQQGDAELPPELAAAVEGANADAGTMVLEELEQIAEEAKRKLEEARGRGGDLRDPEVGA